MPSDNAESEHHQTRGCVPLAGFTPGYPVLGITFLTPISGLETCPDWGASLGPLMTLGAHTPRNSKSFDIKFES
jgi:hypothetical protein